MSLHVIDNGVVIAHVATYAQASRSHPTAILLDAAKYPGAQVGWLWNGSTLAPPTTSPGAVTPLQMRRALRVAGLKDKLEDFLATMGEEAQEAWEYAVEIKRDDPLVAAAAAHEGMTPQQVADLFALAASMTE